MQTIELRIRRPLRTLRWRSRPPHVELAATTCDHWRGDLVTLEHVDLVHHGDSHPGYGVRA